MKKLTPNSISILDNSYRFLNESIMYYRKTKRDKTYWPFAVFLLIQCLELLMKYILKQEHHILIFENVDNPKNTVSIAQALERLISISNIEIDEKEKRVIRKAIIYRNQTLHYEPNYFEREIKLNYIQLFEFLHYFHKKHLNEELHNRIFKSLWTTEAELMNRFKEQFVFYNGVEVSKKIPLEIVKMQKFNGVQYGDKEYKRIPYGDEDYGMKSNTCPDCSCLKGQYHLEYCDIERCPACGGQFLSCGCSDEDSYYIHIDDD